MRRIKVGDTVITRQRFDGSNRKGVVESIDGEYIYVRLGYNKSLLECYDCELDIILEGDVDGSV